MSVVVAFEHVGKPIASFTSCIHAHHCCYLLLLLLLVTAGELLRVAQQGFRSCAEYSSLGLDGAVRLANCVNLADQLRMHAALEQAAANSSGGSSSSSGLGSILEGQLLVCKVHLGGILQEAEGHVQLAATNPGNQPQAICGRPINTRWSDT